MPPDATNCPPLLNAEVAEAVPPDATSWPPPLDSTVPKAVPPAETICAAPPEETNCAAPTTLPELRNDVPLLPITTASSAVPLENTVSVPPPFTMVPVVVPPDTFWKPRLLTMVLGGSAAGEHVLYAAAAHRGVDARTTGGDVLGAAAAYRRADSRAVRDDEEGGEVALDTQQWFSAPPTTFSVPPLSTLPLAMPPETFCTPPRLTTVSLTEPLRGPIQSRCARRCSPSCRSSFRHGTHSRGHRCPPCR